MNKFNQKLIGSHRVSGRFMRFLLSVMLVVPLVMAMSSCVDDKDDEPVIDNASELYGTWSVSVTTQSTDYTSIWESNIILNSQGKLFIWGCEEYMCPGSSTIDRWCDYYSWYEVIDNIIKVYGVHNDTIAEYVLSYKVVGNNLILEYISGDNPSILHGQVKKDKVVYTNKSKNDLVEYPYGSWKATISTGNILRMFSLGINMDNELGFSEKVQSSSNYSVLEKYRYEFTGNKIEIYKEDNLSTKPDCILSYKTTGNNITLEYISGERPLFISVFNSDKVTYEINK